MSRAKEKAVQVIKFWMVLSSIVFGMVISVYEGYAQEAPIVIENEAELPLDLVQEEDIDTEYDDEEEAEGQQEAVVLQDNELVEKAIASKQVEEVEDVPLEEAPEADSVQEEKVEAEELTEEEKVGPPEQEVIETSPKKQKEQGADKEGEEEIAVAEEETTVEPMEQADEAPQDEDGTLEEGEGGVKQATVEEETGAPEQVVSGSTEDIKVDTESEEVKLDENDEDKALETMDTVNLKDPQGNWLIKRFWFNKAEQLYEQMSLKIQRIFDFGVEFQEKSAELDQKLFDPFYLDIGIGRGELTQLVDSLIAQLLEDDTDLSAERDEQEAEYLRQLEEEKGTLEQLKADIEGVSDIDSAVNNALATFNERANVSRNYHSKAWNLLQEIAHELNDKKARELYFTIKSLARSIVDIEEYITSPFLEYFDGLSKKADEQVNRIKQEVAVLKQKGIDLKKKVDDLEHAQQKEQLEEAEHQGRDTAELEQQKREKKERGFFSSIGSMVQYMWNTFYAFLQKLFGPAKKVDAQEEGVQEEEAEEQALDEASVAVDEVIELQEEEAPEEVDSVIKNQETEMELASDAEQQEVMTAGSEEVELVKKKEDSDASEVGNGMTEEEREVQPARSAQESTMSPVETESNQEQAQ